MAHRVGVSTREHSVSDNDLAYEYWAPFLQTLFNVTATWANVIKLFTAVSYEYL